MSRCNYELPVRMPRAVGPGLVFAIWILGIASGPRAEPANGPEPRDQREFCFQRKWVGVEVAPSKIVGQNEVSEYACGLAAIYHALRFGNKRMQAAVNLLPGMSGVAKVQGLLDVYGKKPSRDYSSGLRWRNDGISAQDLTDIYNDVPRNQQAFESRWPVFEPKAR